MLRLHALRQCARGQSAIVRDWLKDPSINCLPHPALLSPVELSKILSTITIQKLPPPDEIFWSKTIERLQTSLRSSSPSPASWFVSTLHILDRFASFGVVNENLDKLLRSVNTCVQKVSAMDAFIGTRAMLLLGWQSEIPLCTAANLRTMSNTNLTMLSQLACSCQNEKLGTILVSILTERFGSGDLNSFSTTDLISGVGSLVSLYAWSTRGRREVTSCLKSCATELVRRIELGFVSPHSCVKSVEIFSGSPPAPISPLLLQACYAFLLENWNYKLLSRFEVSRLLHACILSEIENIVLTPILVREFVKNKKLHNEDPRTALRMMAAVSLSKATVDPALIHAVSRDVHVDQIKLFDDVSILATAFLNCLYNGVCLSKVDEFINSDVMNSVIEVSEDIEDLGTVALLISVSREMTCFSNDHALDHLDQIPSSALEITGKSNPALPRNDMKKKRLVKRVSKRAESMFSQDNSLLDDRVLCSHSIDMKRGDLLTTCLVKCASLMAHSEETESGTALMPTDSLTSPGVRTKTSAENRDACLDIFSSLAFSCEDMLDNATVSELENILCLANACIETLADHPPKLPMEERDGMMESVRSHVRCPVHSVDSPIRISLVLDQ